jgi:HPt (histidine-containing phosphotransfer) domain-containing protein
LEARIDAAGKAADAGVKLRLWQEALAIAPEDARVRLGALRAALAAGRDNLALAIRSDAPQHEPQLTGAERASIAEALAAAAERLDDLKSAQSYLDAAIQLHPPNQRDSLRRKFQTLTAELQRRAKNAARQPVVRNVIEQGTIVAPRILRSVQ